MPDAEALAPIMLKHRDASERAAVGSAKAGGDNEKTRPHAHAAEFFH
jgi:hypothetical protein